MRLVLALLAATLVTCSGLTGPSYRAAREDLSAGRIQAAIGKFETLRDQHPNHPEIRTDLGVAYYRAAREALDAELDQAYLAYLEKSQNEFLTALELDEYSPSPHTWMGIVAAYQADIDRAHDNFENARRLDPGNPIAYTNIAEVYIYKGELSKARRYLEKARRMGAPPIIIELNEVLAAWRHGDYVEARDLFDMAYGLNPDYIRMWNEAPISEPIESFEDLTEFCCGHVACGPYMENACRDMEHQVARRNLEVETLREEMRIEMERRRRLQEIYRNKDVQILIEDPEEAP